MWSATGGRRGANWRRSGQADPDGNVSDLDPSLILELAPANAAEDAGEQFPRDSDLGHLECDVAFVSGNLDAILISFWTNVVLPLRQREYLIRVTTGP